MILPQNDIERVVETLMVRYEDNIKSFIFACRIVSSLVFYFGISKHEFEVRFKGYKLAKQMFDLRLAESSIKHTRFLIIGERPNEAGQITNRYSIFRPVIFSA